MSRPGIIVGLLFAVTLHFIVLMPVKSTSHSMPTATAASIKMREIPDSTPEHSPVEQVQEEVKPVQQPKPAPKPTPKPAPKPRPEPSAPAATNLARVVAPQQSSLEGPGDFAGTSDGTRRPSLRIDWGSPEQAHDVVTAAGMRLVMLASVGGIAGEAVPTGDGWQRVDSDSADLSSYSNRVRIVDATPAFFQAASLCVGGERLAVLLPLSLEHTLRTQQIRTAAEAGVESSRIRAFYGRFRINGGRVAFDISGFERRSS